MMILLGFIFKFHFFQLIFGVTNIKREDGDFLSYGGRTYPGSIEPLKIFDLIFLAGDVGTAFFDGHIHPPIA